MITLDIETSGIDFNKCGIWQIGALDIETGEEFFQEARIDSEDFILEDDTAGKSVYEIIGKTEEELRDKTKQSQKRLLENFVNWVGKRKKKIFICMNPQFDWTHIWIKAKKYGVGINFEHKAFDLHSITQLKYFEINKKFFFKENNLSGFGFKKIIDFCGLDWKDYEKNIHNALKDSKLTAECFYRIVYGKNLLPEFSESKIPNYLK